MLWFNFILGLNAIFLYFWVSLCMIMSLKQRNVKFKPRIKLNQNMYLYLLGTNCYILFHRLSKVML